MDQNLQNTLATISYQGTVKISIKDKNKIIKTFEYHNNGTDELFKFLCLCIGGDYKATDRLRPFKIKLFDRNDPYSRGIAPKTDLAVSGLVSVNKPATYNLTENKIAVTLHFLIPYSNISGTQVCQMCLYGKEYGNDDITKFSAYYYLTDENNMDWNPIIIDNNRKANYSLIIDWTLAFTNI